MTFLEKNLCRKVRTFLFHISITLALCRSKVLWRYTLYNLFVHVQTLFLPTMWMHSALLLCKMHTSVRLPSPVMVRLQVCRDSRSCMATYRSTFLFANKVLQTVFYEIKFNKAWLVGNLTKREVKCGMLFQPYHGNALFWTLGDHYLNQLRWFITSEP